MANSKEITTEEMKEGGGDGKRKEENKSLWEKTKEFLGNRETQTQIVKTTVGTTASIAGLKSLYDVPVYLRQRFMVRGMFGKGKGLEGSIDDVLSTSQEMRERPKIKGEEGGRSEVREAIKDLNKRLNMTQEGGQKHSEQRKLIAKILRENRIHETMNKNDRSKQITEILDEYTTTKVTGAQAARETLNTALVASGAYTLRGISYGFMDGVGRYQTLNKQAKKEGKSVSILKDVIVGGIKKTWREARFQNEGNENKTKTRKGLSAVMAWGKKRDTRG